MPCQKSSVDLTMPQNLEKVELDRKLDKAEIKKNLINKPAGMKMDDKHKYKINNIVNEAAVLKDCYMDENNVNTAIRRYMEPSQGDSIFH